MIKSWDYFKKNCYALGGAADLSIAFTTVDQEIMTQKIEVFNSDISPEYN